MPRRSRLPVEEKRDWEAAVHIASSARPVSTSLQTPGKNGLNRAWLVQVSHMAKLSALLTVTTLALVAKDGVAFSRPILVTRAPSLCAATEDTVFGCAQGQKIISLSATPAVDGGRARLRYVYGTQAKIELEVSRPDAFTSGITALSGGGIDYVRVRNDEFSYVVYTAMAHEWSQDGWIVESNGSPISHHICRGGATGPNVWSPVYAARLPKAPDSDTFSLPPWLGTAPRPPAR